MRQKERQLKEMQPGGAEHVAKPYVDKKKFQFRFPPAPRCAPEGFRIVDEPPPAAALVPKDPEQQTLVGRSMLYCWPSVGWCVGLIKEANGDRRFKMDGH